MTELAPKSCSQRGYSLISILAKVLTGHFSFNPATVTWLSLVMSMMVSFVLSFFPRDVLDEILNLIGSVSEGFPSYSYSSIHISK